MPIRVRCLTVFLCKANSFEDIPGPSLLSSTTQDSSAKGPVSQQPANQQSPPQAPKPNYDAFNTFTHSHPASGTSTPGGMTAFQTPQLPQSPQPPSDPFASFSSTTNRQQTNLPPQASAPSTTASSSLFDFSSPTPQSKQQPASNTNGVAAEDDWDFASALPEDNRLPSSNELVVSNTSVNIVFKASRIGQTSDTVSIAAQFSNNTSNLISEFTFQVAVTKVHMALLRLFDLANA